MSPVFSLDSLVQGSSALASMCQVPALGCRAPSRPTLAWMERLPIKALVSPARWPGLLRVHQSIVALVHALYSFGQHWFACKDAMSGYLDLIGRARLTCVDKNRNVLVQQPVYAFSASRPMTRLTVDHTVAVLPINNQVADLIVSSGAAFRCSALATFREVSRRTNALLASRLAFCRRYSKALFHHVGA